MDLPLSPLDPFQKQHVIVQTRQEISAAQPLCVLAWGGRFATINHKIVRKMFVAAAATTHLKVARRSIWYGRYNQSIDKPCMFSCGLACGRCSWIVNGRYVVTITSKLDHLASFYAHMGSFKKEFQCEESMQPRGKNGQPHLVPSHIIASGSPYPKWIIKNHETYLAEQLSHHP